MLDLPGVAGGGTSGQNSAEQETLPGSLSGKDRSYKAGGLKSREAGRESERLVVPGKARKTTRRREGALL